MALSRLLIENLRNIEACDLNLSQGFNFLIGANASGKSSVLEAIYYLGHGRSFRTHQTGRVINDDADAFTLFGRVVSADRSDTSLGIKKTRQGETELKIDGEKGQRLAQLASILPMQLIHPDGFELLNAGPKYRRAFIDWGMFHVEPSFYSVWTKFNKVLKQRNAMLKTATHYREVSHWDKELLPLAEQIDMWRCAYVESLVETAKVMCQIFLPEFTLNFSYRRGWEKNTSYQEILAENFQRDQQLGYTYNGPHRSDLVIRKGTSPVHDVLSRGQLKLLVCALRLAQGLQLKEKKNKQCIYLIDDFASELDPKRRSLLVEQLKATNSQVFVSAISADHIAEMRDENSKMFYVEHGKITAE